MTAVLNEGSSIRRAALECGIPKSSLGDRISGRVLVDATCGPSTYMSPREETELHFALEINASNFPVKQGLATTDCTYAIYSQKALVFCVSLSVCLSVQIVLPWIQRRMDTILTHIRNILTKLS